MTRVSAPPVPPAPAAPPGVTLELVHGPLPDALAAEADAAADNPYVTLRETRASAPALLPRLHHVVVRRNGSLAQVLSVHEAGRALVAVNRCVALPDDVLAACANRLFAAFPGTRRLEIASVRDDATPTGPGAARTRRIPRGLENFVLALPASVDAYHATFSARSRQKFRNYERHLARAHPAAAWRLARDHEIDPALVDGIVELNHRRMAAQGGLSAIDAAQAAALLSLVRDGGAVGVFVDGARVLGGTICARVGRGWTLMVLAHDPALDAMSLGTLCLLRTVDAAIGDGATVFNLLWGKYAYKERFGAHAIPLSDRRIYRTRGAWLADWPVKFPVYRRALRDAYWTLRRRLRLGRFLPWRHAAASPPVDA